MIGERQEDSEGAYTLMLAHKVFCFPLLESPVFCCFLVS